MNLPKKIIITGGAGFIGANLVRYMVDRRHCHVINIDKLTYAGNPHSLKGVDHNLHELKRADIVRTSEMGRIISEHKPLAVIHLAAESHVDRSIDGPGEFITTNVVGTYSLLQASLDYWRNLDANEKADFRFLHVSTDEVFGSLGTTGAFEETTPYNPRSPYSSSKACSDHLVRAWGETYGLPVLVTNCSNNYGPYQFPEKLIPVVILKAINGEPIPVYGNGENVRDWLYVEDHCKALWSVLINGRTGETYNIGGENEQSNLQLVRNICGILDEIRPREDGKPYAGQITFVTDRPGHDFRYAMNISKIRRELGWEPSENHDSGMRKTIQWYLNNEWWWKPIISGEYKMQRLGNK